MSGFAARAASQAAGAGRIAPAAWCDDPNMLPLFLTPATNRVAIWCNGIGYYEDAYGGLGSSIWQTHIEDCGAVKEISTTGWETICDLTGAGIMGAVMAPTYNVSNVFAVGIRITRDGVRKTFESPANQYAAYSRLVLGGSPGCYMNQWGQSVPGNGAGPFGAGDRGFNDLPLTNGIPLRDYNTITHPQDQLKWGMPVLRFETGLKVEIKCTALGATSAQKTGYVTYLMDKGVLG